ncbi:hypothetical protein BaRGS_00025050 [Batillaria attramentaria]|uniref:RNA 2-O ribose methyltransferase substrate binding domain-containing protein n=1 Tax=Batillaria attramentaria TaxID=370345 RepID=A0ABD0K9D2_9CAEN
MAAPIRACCCKHSARTLLKFSCTLTFPQSVRWYSRGFRRKPIAVSSPETDLQRIKAKGGLVQNPRLNPYVPYVPGDPTQQAQLKVAKSGDARKLKDTSQASANKQDQLQRSRVSQQKTPTFADSGLRYEKLEEGDKRFGQVLMTARSRKEREKKGIILLEGRRLILDSLKAGAHLKYLYFSDLSLVAGLPQELLRDADLYKVQYRHLKIWADTHTPAGILGVFAKPDEGEVLLPQQDTLPMTVVCDNVRDPGNMGTLIRTAAAAGCRKILATKGCVDVWDPKVLRGAMGAHFYTAILNNLTWSQVGNHIPAHTTICIADARKDTVLQRSFDVDHPEVLNMLSVGKDTEASSESDSDDEDTSSSGEESESRRGTFSLAKVSYETDDAQEQAAKLNKEKKQLYSRLPLSVVDYSDLDCSKADSVAVVIGGETEGVSAQAKKFAFDRYGQYVTIPMVQAADSLNTATAAAVILYEIRRQLVARLQKEEKSNCKSAAS